MSNTVVIRGAGPGIRIKMPSKTAGSVTMVSKGKSTKVELNGSTSVRFAA